jgi:polysaccharide chain length determinant protein (PEP-CTERM system associated)
MAARSIFDVFQILLSAGWRRRYLICVPILVLPFIGLTVGILTPKGYEARMTILVQEPAKLNPFLNDLAIGPNMKDRMEGLKALLHSEHILGGVVRDLKLVGDAPSQKATDYAVRTLAKNLKTVLIGADMVELRLTGKSPEGLDRVLSLIGARFIDRLLAPERSSIENSVTFLGNEITEKRDTLNRAEAALAEFKARNADKLPELYAANIVRLGAMKQSLEEKRTALAGATGALEDMRSRLAAANPVIGRIEDSIVQVSGDLALLRARYTEDHSEVQGAVRRLRRLEEERRSVLEAANGISTADLGRLMAITAGGGSLSEKAAPLLMSQMTKLQEAESKPAALRQEVQQIEMAVEELQRTVANYGDIDREQQTLTRAVQSAREVHDQLAKRYEMARVTGSLGRFEAPERIKLIDPPTEPTTPTTPPAILFLVFGIVGGLILGVGLAMIAETLDGSLRRRDQIEKLLGVPMLSRIPAIATPEPAKLFDRKLVTLAE